ncbi:hypothetical protein RchiOBHm_Chr1g0322931 [Rosa chinensis]|uniref:Uncharacterized protein n=1 Tax=Rosa chinensis TaxID=74649 RepID=A0A2P6S9H1_ROSCH|nr:hypothetical protein RchiOBHm_Chr1g0322931 [Rosa chinensis]
MILILYGIAGGLHHLRIAKEKVHIGGESLTLFFLAFFLSLAAILCFFTVLFTLLSSSRSSPLFFSLCSAFYIAPIMSLVCIKHRVLEFNLE